MDCESRAVIATVLIVVLLWFVLILAVSVKVEKLEKRVESLERMEYKQDDMNKKLVEALFLVARKGAER